VERLKGSKVIIHLKKKVIKLSAGMTILAGLHLFFLQEMTIKDN
jgi:hypothetical protein